MRWPTLRWFDNPHDDARVRFELGGVVGEGGEGEGEDAGNGVVASDEIVKVRTRLFRSLVGY